MIAPATSTPAALTEAPPLQYEDSTYEGEQSPSTPIRFTRALKDEYEDSDTDPTKFNRTFSFPVSNWSPMLDFDTLSTPLEYESGSDGRFGPDPPTAGEYSLSFVGTSYKFNGGIYWAGALGSEPDFLGQDYLYDSVQPNYKKTTALEREADVTTEAPLGFMRDLPLSVYAVHVKTVKGSSIRFENATVDIPSITQA